jgi:hypothetical protein
VPITEANPFKGRQYPGEVILHAVRWYLRYPLAYEHVAELLAERGLEVDASCVWRRVQAYSPELSRRCRPHLKHTQQELPCGRDIHKGERPRQISIGQWIQEDRPSTFCSRRSATDHGQLEFSRIDSPNLLPVRGSLPDENVTRLR